MPRFVRPVGLVVVAAIVGYVLARSASSSDSNGSSLSRTATSPAFTVRYPSNWATRPARTLPGLSLGHSVAVGPTATTGDRLQIGTSRVATVGTLPAGLLSSVSARPTAATVTVGPYTFDRYLDLHLHGHTGATSIYLLATTRATIAATCTTSGTGTAFAAQCERVLATLRLPAGTHPSAGVSAAYALQLNGILSTLNRARAADGPGLRSASVPARVRAADALATAEAGAAGQARKLPAGRAGAANLKLAGALTRAAGAYRSLATAATKDDRAGYAAAEKQLTGAQKTLTAAFKQLAALGYRLR